MSMRGQPEQRSIKADVAELRVDRAGGEPVIVGYACVYGAYSVDLGGFIESFAPGAFGAALAAGADVRFLVNHDPSLILGRNKAGTLTLVEDEKGLRVECRPPATSIGDHYLSAVERGDISGMSFRFYVSREEWNFDASPPQRRVIEADIDDACLATYPAFPDSSAAVRMLHAARRMHSAQPEADRLAAHRDRLQRLLEAS